MSDFDEVMEEGRVAELAGPGSEPSGEDGAVDNPFSDGSGADESGAEPMDAVPTGKSETPASPKKKKKKAGGGNSGKTEKTKGKEKKKKKKKDKSKKDKSKKKKDKKKAKKKEKQKKASKKDATAGAGSAASGGGSATKGKAVPASSEGAAAAAAENNAGKSGGDKSGGDKSGGDKSGGDKSGGNKSGGEEQAIENKPFKDLIAEAEPRNEKPHAAWMLMNDRARVQPVIDRSTQTTGGEKTIVEKYKRDYDKFIVKGEGKRHLPSKAKFESYLKQKEDEAKDNKKKISALRAAHNRTDIYGCRVHRVGLRVFPAEDDKIENPNYEQNSKSWAASWKKRVDSARLPGAEDPDESYDAYIDYVSKNGFDENTPEKPSGQPIFDAYLKQLRTLHDSLCAKKPQPKARIHPIPFVLKRSMTAAKLKEYVTLDHLWILSIGPETDEQTADFIRKRFAGSRESNPSGQFFAYVDYSFQIWRGLTTQQAQTLFNEPRFDGNHLSNRHNRAEGSAPNIFTQQQESWDGIHIPHLLWEQKIRRHEVSLFKKILKQRRRKELKETIKAATKKPGSSSSSKKKSAAAGATAAKKGTRKITQDEYDMNDDLFAPPDEDDGSEAGGGGGEGSSSGSGDEDGDYEDVGSQSSYSDRYSDGGDDSVYPSADDAEDKKEEEEAPAKAKAQKRPHAGKSPRAQPTVSEKPAADAKEDDISSSRDKPLQRTKSFVQPKPKAGLTLKKTTEPSQQVPEKDLSGGSGDDGDDDDPNTVKDPVTGEVEADFGSDSEDAHQEQRHQEKNKQQPPPAKSAGKKPTPAGATKTAPPPKKDEKNRAFPAPTKESAPPASEVPREGSVLGTKRKAEKPDEETGERSAKRAKASHDITKSAGGRVHFEKPAATVTTTTTTKPSTEAGKVGGGGGGASSRKRKAGDDGQDERSAKRQKADPLKTMHVNHISRELREGHRLEELRVMCAYAEQTAKRPEKNQAYAPISQALSEWPTGGTVMDVARPMVSGAYGKDTDKDGFTSIKRMNVRSMMAQAEVALDYERAFYRAVRDADPSFMSRESERFKILDEFNKRTGMFD